MKSESNDLFYSKTNKSSSYLIFTELLFANDAFNNGVNYKYESFYL